MESTVYLAICFGSILGLGLLAAGARYLPRKWKKTARRWFLVHLYYPSLTLCARPNIKRFDILLFAIVVGGNTCSVSIGANHRSEFSRRLGHAALVNMILLCLGGRMNALVNRVALRQERYLNLHRLFGFLMVVEAGIHSVLTGAAQTPRPHEKAQVAGIVVSGTAYPPSAHD